MYIPGNDHILSEMTLINLHRARFSICTVNKQTIETNWHSYINMGTTLLSPTDTCTLLTCVTTKCTCVLVMAVVTRGHALFIIIIHSIDTMIIYNT